MIDPVLRYSTYLGGSGLDDGRGIAVNGFGDTYITGFTQSVDFPRSNPLPAPNNALQGVPGCLRDQARQKRSSSSIPPTWAAAAGRGHRDRGRGQGAAYITGNTSSANFPRANPLPALNNALQGPQDAFVSKLSPTGNALVYSTYLGGSSSDVGRGIAVDGLGAAYITGTPDRPTFHK